MPEDLLINFFKELIKGALKLWRFWLSLFIISAAIVILKARFQGDERQSNNLSQSNKCPRCGGDLRRINGKYGPFYGCSNFPKCTYKEKI